MTTPAGTPIHPQFRIIDGLSGRRDSANSERRDDLLSPPAMGEFAPPHAPAALRFSDSDRRWVVTAFAAASAVGGAAAGASTGRDAT